MNVALVIVGVLGFAAMLWLQGRILNGDHPVWSTLGMMISMLTAILALAAACSGGQA